MNYKPEDVDELVKRAKDAVADYQGGGVTEYTAYRLELALAPFTKPQTVPLCKTCGGRGTVSDWQEVPLKANTEYSGSMDFHKKCPDCSAAAAPTTDKSDDIDQ